MDVVDLAVSGVCEDGVFDCTRHLLDIPNQGLVVVGYGQKKDKSKLKNGHLKYISDKDVYRG